MIRKYKVTGMSCAACSARVERTVGALEGVESCSVNLLTGDMSVDGAATDEEITEAVVAIGYGIESDKPSTADTRDGRVDSETRGLIARLFISLGLVAVLMYFSMGHMLGIPTPEWFETNPVANGIIQMLISLCVMFINQRFFISGAKALVGLSPNMDTLVSLGSLASFGYSFAMLIAMSFDVASGGDGGHYLHEFYFESAAMILALITLGKMLESRAKGKTTDALKSLISLKGKNATLITDGEERVISIDDIKVGDVLAVRPGESIPTDGEIIYGSSATDESMLTGESLPRDVSLGDSVYGGTMNTSGYIRIKATKVGEGTVLSAIINMVKEASGSKAPIAKLADRVSAVFVPAVMSVALFTFIGWLIAGREVGFAIARGISVLVISCPCALGLATPVAIMVGSGVGARRGVLFKNATALEVSGRVKCVVLDKTGTVTEGAPRVTDVITSHGVDKKRLISVAYSLESHSEHPLARAVVDYARQMGIESQELTDFEALGSRGVSGVIDGSPVLGVSLSYAEELIGDALPVADAERLSEEGKTPLVFIFGGKYIGMIAVSDTVKSDALESISRLHSMGLRVIMLSGDNERCARAVAASVGIDEVIAGVLPDGKETVIRELQGSGRVAMVGDGINDAPALTRADVGIAIGRGTDIAVESADVVVMGKGLSEVADAIGIGRATLTNIRENLFWAFIYNCLGIPLAAGLFGLALNPMLGAAMMSLSSFSVVTNALRLNFWRPRRKGAATCEKSDENNETKENKTMTVTINVDGMMCPHCEARVKRACEEIEGVTLATPSHTAGTVVVEMTKDVTDACISAIAAAGYDVK